MRPLTQVGPSGNWNIKVIPCIMNILLSYEIILAFYKIVIYKYEALMKEYIGFDIDCKKKMACVVENGKKDL